MQRKAPLAERLLFKTDTYLEIQLQRELNLSRTIASVASRRSFAECSTAESSVPVRREVRGTADGINPVAPESWGVEVRMVQDVKELRAEFHAESLGDLEVLEEREIQPVISRTGKL